MKSKSIYQVIFFHLIVFSCSKDAGNCISDHDSQVIKGENTIKLDIPLEGRPYDFSVFSVCEDADTTFLYYYTADQHAVQIVNLNEKRFLPAIKLASEGTEGIPTVDDMVVMHPDTIFLFSEEYQKGFWIRPNGVIIDVKDFSEFSSNEAIPVYIVNKSPYSKIQVTPNKTFLFQISYELSDEYYTPELYHFPHIGIWQPGTETIQNTGTFPDNYQQERTAFEDYYPIAYNNRAGIIATAFGSSHLIGATSIKDQQTQFACVASAHLPVVFNLLRYDAPFEKRNELYRTEGFYTHILYDSYRDLYVRLVKHAQERTDVDGKLRQYLQSSWSMIVLNKNFQIEREINLPAENYQFDITAITRMGLLVSRETPYAQDNQEEMLNLALINL